MDKIQDTVRIENYKEKQIVVIDFTSAGSNWDKTIEINDQALKMLSSMPPNSALTLTNITGMRFNMDIIIKFQENIAKVKDRERAAAVVGISGLGQVAFNAIISATKMKNIKVFSSTEEALEWLITQ